MTSVSTPNTKQCDEVARFLNVPLSQIVKSVALVSEPNETHPEPQFFLALVRADHELNEVKLSKIEGLKQGFRLAGEAEIIQHIGCKPGYIGPVHPATNITIIADLTVANMSDFICGANQEDHHLTGVNWVRDLAEPTITADIRNVVVGDTAPDGQGQLAIQRGIEVGHVFFLGTRYSEALKATYLDEQGKPQVAQMGCYGIGITRLAGAAIEQNHDDKGIFWPRAIAPFEVVICPVGWSKSTEVKETAESLYHALRDQGVDVILDDRDERPGSMFADWELIGVPVRVTIGERGLKEGLVEMQLRKHGETQKVNASVALEHCLKLLNEA